jgi:hypothetical protein
MATDGGSAVKQNRAGLKPPPVPASIAPSKADSIFQFNVRVPQR